jgi:hypothetical protein
MTFNELMFDAIKYDEERMAYSVFWLIKNGIVKGTDNANNVDWDLVNHQEVEEMRKRNELNLKPIKLYSVPMGNNFHMIIFAESVESARGHYLNETGKLPAKIFDITTKMDKSFWFEDIKKYKSLRQLRDETLVFPATAMIFEKG